MGAFFVELPAKSQELQLKEREDHLSRWNSKVDMEAERMQFSSAAGSRKEILAAAAAPNTHLQEGDQT